MLLVSEQIVTEFTKKSFSNAALALNIKELLTDMDEKVHDAIMSVEVKNNYENVVKNLEGKYGVKIDQIVYDIFDKNISSFNHPEIVEYLIKRIFPPVVAKTASKTYPEEIMKILRQRRNLDENDKSHDEDILKQSPQKVFDSCLQWEGIIGYTNQIYKWIKDIWGVDLRTKL